MSKSQMMSTTNYHFHSLNRMKATSSKYIWRQKNSEPHMRHKKKTKRSGVKHVGDMQFLFVCIRIKIASCPIAHSYNLYYVPSYVDNNYNKGIYIICSTVIVTQLTDSFVEIKWICIMCVHMSLESINESTIHDDFFS